MDRLDVSKFLFYAVSIAAFFSLSFAFGLYSGANQTVVYEAVVALGNTVDLVFEEATTLSKTHPKHFLYPARVEGAGVVVNEVSGSQDAFIFLAGFFEQGNQLRLIQRDGTVISRWPVSFSEIFPDPQHLKKPGLWGPPRTDWNIDIHGALALPDGSVVFNFEYGGLVKLDRCGNVVWTLARASHHSVERAESGGFWVPGRRFVSAENDSPFPPFETPFKEDTIMKVSADGDILTEISVPKLFYDSGLQALLTATGHWFRHQMDWDREIVHLNKVAELPSAIAKDFSMFEAGDLALSIRELNLVMIINPHTQKIKWWRMGPWLRQHDPEFIPDGKLLVFNNNIYPALLNAVADGSRTNVSNIIEYDFAADNYRIVYGDRKGQVLLTTLRGKHELTRQNGLLVTEFEGGRVFETDVTGRIIWEYINRYDADEVAAVSEARLYPVDYFHIADWSCQEKEGA